MSCCRLWISSLCLFLICPGLFFSFFSPLSGIERLSHTLSGTWKYLCFAEASWQTQERRWRSQVCVCQRLAWLRHCGWPITLKSPTVGGGASVPLWAGVVIRCVVDKKRKREGFFVFTIDVQNWFLVTVGSGLSLWGPESRKWNKMRVSEGVGTPAVCSMLNYI